jgi:hypothetical protein
MFVVVIVSGLLGVVMGQNAQPQVSSAANGDIIVTANAIKFAV